MINIVEICQCQQISTSGEWRQRRLTSCWDRCFVVNHSLLLSPRYERRLSAQKGFESMILQTPQPVAFPITEASVAPIDVLLDLNSLIFRGPGKRDFLKLSNMSKLSVQFSEFLYIGKGLVSINRD
ncbi:uncharacterized protein LOC131802715 [Musca domestica]|uniref:Uncharacterized protein LOC131802715 n=1 Tax=Musca domestica TaxID=7370 RepID=A0ABM3V010_MUSDO|nr:uncharacterized protein LOC131802715 [Musca domestica]